MASIADPAGLPRGANPSIGNVLSRAFSAVGSNPVTFFGLTFLFGALPSALFNYLQVQYTLAGAGGGATGPGLGVTFVVLRLIGFVVSIGLAMLVQGALVRATTAYARGERATISESALAGLRAALPLLGLAIVTGVAVVFGLILLLVPGVILYIMWSVAAPALVEERRGVFSSLGRSRQLTKGARWKVFGLQLLILVFVWIVAAVIGFILLAVGLGRSSGTPGGLFGGFTMGLIVVQLISSTIITTFWSAIQTSLYVELRDWKDGTSPDRLSDIFA